MGYVVGLATKEEAKELERRGWTLEVPPQALNTAENDEGEPNPLTSIMIWVDSNLMDIMSGAGWDESPLRNEVLAQLAEIDALENQYRLGTHDYKSLLRRVAGIEGEDDCLGRQGACSPTCPGWAWFNSNTHGFIVEQCDECARFKGPVGDLEAQMHILDCSHCRESSKKQLSEIIKHLSEGEKT